MNASDPGTSILAMADLATPMSIRVAATLGLVEQAGGGGATVAELASRTEAFEPALRRLLDHLVAIGVFDLDVESGRYRPTSLGEQIGGDSPEGVKVLLDMNSAGGRAELAFVELLETIHTGTPAYPLRYGRPFWADLDAEPALRASVIEPLRADRAGIPAERFLIDVVTHEGGQVAAGVLG
ncbi:hypothetical protein [Nocardia sp. NBC_01388]|uniref:methyltransferase family protein n=1 Tax=Nocardia sp. NBC_01388 TaxID=2903596 RepID=UPI00324334F3